MFEYNEILPFWLNNSEIPEFRITFKLPCPSLAAKRLDNHSELMLLPSLRLAMSQPCHPASRQMEPNLKDLLWPQQVQNKTHLAPKLMIWPLWPMMYWRVRLCIFKYISTYYIINEFNLYCRHLTSGFVQELTKVL